MRKEPLPLKKEQKNDSLKKIQILTSNVHNLLCKDH